MKRWLTLFFILSFWGIADADSTADETSARWYQAQSQFEKEDWAGAIKTLESLSESRLSSQPGYFFNLGLAYYKQGQLGYARAYVEKANQIKPHDAATQHLLQMVHSDFKNKTSGDWDSASTTWETLLDRVSLDEIRGVLGMLGFILVLLWVRPYRRYRSIRKTVLHPASLLGLIALFLTAGLYFMQRYANLHSAAICIETQVVRSGPGDGFLDLSRLSAGSKVRVLSEPTPALDGETTGSGTLWRQIRFTQDAIGWVKTSGLIIL